MVEISSLMSLFSQKVKLVNVLACMRVRVWVCLLSMFFMVVCACYVWTQVKSCETSTNYIALIINKKGG